jgi:putative ABC transport system permease protein
MRDRADAADAAGGSLPRSRMGARPLVAESVAGLLQRPGRSLLTMLGTILGIGSFVVILGLSATASGQISHDFSLLKATQVTVHPQGTTPVAIPADATARLARIDGVVDSGTWWRIDPPTGDGFPVRAGLSQDDVPVDLFAAAPGAMRAAQLHLVQGRLYDDYAEQHASHVIVLSAAAAQQLGIRDISQGPAVFVGDDAYTVVGIFDAAPGLSQVLTGALLPTSTVLARYGQPLTDNPETVLIRTRVGAAQVVADQAAVALRPDAATLLAAQAPPEPEALRASVTGNVNALVLVLAIVTLVIGAVGIANTTLVAVVERTPEIGLRRALGARPRHVAGQFLVDATVLGAIGGIVGTSLALAVVLVISVAQHWTPLIAPAVVLAAPFGGAVVGMLAGAYPAWRASRVEPVVALQH